MPGGFYDGPFRCVCAVRFRFPLLPLSLQSKGSERLEERPTAKHDMQNGMLTWVKMAWKIAWDRELSSFITVEAERQRVSQPGKSRSELHTPIKLRL